MRYTADQLKSMAIRALDAHGKNNEQWAMLVLRMYARLGLTEDQLYIMISKLAKQ